MLLGHHKAAFRKLEQYLPVQFSFRPALWLTWSTACSTGAVHCECAI